MRILRRQGAGARGFTLIELMITVAIVAIVASVAYPAYTRQVQKSNRAQGKARLVQAAQLLERFYSDNSTYYLAVTGGNLAAGSSESTAAGFAKLMNVTSGTTVYSGPNNETASPFQVTICNRGVTFNTPPAVPTCNGTASPSSFTVSATPQGGQTADTKCGTLTLTNTGVRGISGTGTVAECW